MNSFDVLNSQENIHRNCVLEASAGTGKTFAIEHLVVRFLLEPPHYSLDQILLVTFTKPATHDLKIRIRSNIEKALLQLQTIEEISSEDYLNRFRTATVEEINKAKRHLERALFTFDQAQIFTIHSFCARMLREYAWEGDIGISFISQESISIEPILSRVVHDFFRVGIQSNNYSHNQLALLLKEYKQSIEDIESDLIKQIRNIKEIPAYPSFSELFHRFCLVLKGLQEQYCFVSEKIVEDYLTQAPSYRKLKNPQPLDTIQRFAHLFNKNGWSFEDFDLLIGDGLFILEALDETQRKEKAKQASPLKLHYPHFIEIIRKELAPLISEGRNPMITLRRMAYTCQEWLRKTLSQEEIFTYDDLLTNMQKAIRIPSFCAQIRSQYCIAIIDEFQDTDPIQWDIFQTLFLSYEWKGHVYIVGDPKQAIYSFRQADIYTYIDAVNAIGKENRFSLDTNYRSQPDLVQALNILFSAMPQFLPLPRIRKTIPYNPVKSGAPHSAKTVKDNLGSIHFCLVSTSEKKPSLEHLENEFFFPYFSEQIWNLHNSSGYSFSDFAILVKDRYQAQRISTFLQQHGFPFQIQRQKSLAESPVIEIIRDTLMATMYPRNTSAVKKALGSSLFEWKSVQIAELKDPDKLAQALFPFHLLRLKLLNHGFGPFFDSLLDERLENLLNREGGVEIYNELQQVGALLLEHENATRCGPEGLVSYLDQIETLSSEDEERFHKRTDPTKDGISILTIHASKGLEFGIVFALGLVARTPAPEESDIENLCAESDAEKLRQLYVAVTRPKYRLYIPTIVGDVLSSPEPGCVSPLELFLNQLGPIPSVLDTLKQKASITYHYITSNIPCPCACPCPNLVLGVEANVTTQTPILFPPKEVCIPGKKEILASFTTLAKRTSLPLIAENSHSAPHDFQNPLKTPHTLPAHKDTGNLIHYILEMLPWEWIANSTGSEELIPHLQPYLKDTPFTSWDFVIAEIIRNTLLTPLPTGNGSVALATIPKYRRYQEHEFIFSTNENQNANWIKGVIDLFFVHDNRYYIVDWKSNWLGSSSDAYHSDALNVSMEEHNYFLQAKLYREAAQRYLSLIDPRPPEECFGGTFYLFLRALSPTNPQPHGILFIDH